MTRPLYIVLRNDLIGMSPGRAAAQASHGTSQFHEAHRDLDVTTAPSFSFMKQAFKDWKREAGKFGTTIILQASQKQLTSLVSFAGAGVLADRFDFWFSEIIDPEYCVSGNEEIFVGKDIRTGAVFFVPEESGSACSEELFLHLKGLELY